MKAIEELKHSNCRWPVAEFEPGVFLFCGEVVNGDGKSYCAAHAAVAYKSKDVRGRGW